MDLTQVVLLSIIVILAIFLVVIGIQAYFTLKDLRRTLGRMNALMEHADEVVSEVKKPVDAASNLFGALTAGLGIAHLIKKAKLLEGKHEREQQ